MKRLKIMHLASFAGNIGDNAMHDGAYRTRAADFDDEIDYSRHEIRDYYHWRKRAFDAAFLDEANASDLVIIGGFSLFQLWRAETQTGTYVDAPIDFFSKISKPVVFYGVGADVTRAINSDAVDKCKRFLDLVLGLENYRFSFRNDGSAGLISDVLGNGYTDKMAVIPDGGLFVGPGDGDRPSFLPPQRFVAINIAGDMADIRYGASGETHAFDRFLREIAAGIEAILALPEEVDCVLVPHIYSDLSLISAVLDRLDDRYRRTRVRVAPYVQGETGWRDSFECYRRADLVIGMRYHACLSSMGFATPVLGLTTHHKIAGQFAAYSLQDRCFSWDGDLSGLFETAVGELRAGSKIQQDLAHIRQRERDVLRAHHRDIQSWMQTI